MYLLSDGSTPVLPPGKTVASFWNGMKSGNFDADGISQETCSSSTSDSHVILTERCAGRDLTHTGYGLASIGHVAETARHQ